jgi:hypothetical protein
MLRAADQIVGDRPRLASSEQRVGVDVEAEHRHEMILQVLPDLGRVMDNPDAAAP